MIPALIGAAISLGAGIYGGIKASKQRKEYDNKLGQTQADNEAWFKSNYYQDYTQRADSQNLLRNLRNTLDRENKRTAGVAAITGATPEAQAAAKQQANNVIAETYGNLGALGQQYKDSVMNQYLQRKDAYNQMGLANIDAKAQSGENLMYNSMKSLGNIGSTYLKGIYGIDKGNLLGKKS